MARLKKTVGLTGNIASGKSTVGNIFEELGFSVIEADRIGWELLERADIAKKVIATFGNIKSNGAIDRRRLGGMVFAHASKLKALNAIIHPPLLEELSSRIAQSQEEMLFVNAALIFEWGIEDWFDKIVLVTCRKEKKLERLAKKGLTREASLRRLHAQMPESSKRARSDYIIENDGTLEQLRIKTREVLALLQTAFNMNP